jgi:acyl-CoA thioester hydrolase
MGHLNVRFWVAKALEGLAGLALRLGMPRAFAAEAGATLLVRDQHMRFLREARAGATLTMTGGVVEMGESEARLLLVMRHDSGEPAATFQLQVAHVTPSDLRPFPWPQRILQAAEGLRVEVPAYAQARSIPLDRVASQASLERGQSLGLQRIGLGLIQPPDCDAFGRMRGEIAIGKVSDGVSRVMTREAGDEAETRRLGGAVLEYRVLHLAWPRAGDSIEVLTGRGGCDARVRRIHHWLVDPATGRAWASAMAVGVVFDLDARKIVDL